MKTPTITTPRILRGLLILGSYALTPLYRPGSQNGDADNLSRAISEGRSVKQDAFEFAEVPEIVLILGVQDDMQILALSDASEAPFLAAAVAEATPQDAELRQVLVWCQGQWPEVDPGLPFSPYSNDGTQFR